MRKVNEIMCCIFHEAIRFCTIHKHTQPQMHNQTPILCLYYINVDTIHSHTHICMHIYSRTDTPV